MADEAKKSSHYLTVVQFGSPDYPRYRIQKSDLTYYTGDGWSPVESNALLYSTNHEASKRSQDLLLAEFMDCKVRRFTAPVVIDVFCDEEFTPEELQKWLCRVARLHTDYIAYGHGPVDGSMGVMQIQWSEMKEKT